jgi:hypothetical protein
MPVYWVRGDGRDVLNTMTSVERALSERDTGHPRLHAALKLLHSRWRGQPPLALGLRSRLRRALGRGAASEENRDLVAEFQAVVLDVVETLVEDNRALRVRLAAHEDARDAKAASSGAAAREAQAPETLSALEEADAREIVAHEEPEFWRTRAKELDAEVRALRERLVLLTGILPLDLLEFLDADLAHVRAESGCRLFLDSVDGSLSLKPTDVQTEMELLWSNLGRGRVR